MARDATGATLAGQQVLQPARVDSLTGLVNDTLGHDAGDELLKVMAARLSALLRGVDRLARPAGLARLVRLAGLAGLAGLARLAGLVRLAGLARLVRVGGDDFVVLLDRETDRAGSSKVASRLLTGAIAAPAAVRLGGLSQSLRVFRACPSSASKGPRSRRKAQP